ncbi:MFS transporter [Streptomyces sanglieri]|uniref:MFS transporter n=1 Tax=Streptomyces sanglieri TaxID=193460 RepID=A0ABW2XB39_9ACTN
MVALGAVLFLLTQWFQYAQGYSPLQAGLRVLPAPLALVVTSLLAPALMRAFPIRHVMASGLILMATGLVLPWLAQDSDDHLGYPVMAAALALIGFGAGLATTVASVTLMAATPNEHVSGAAAIEETCYELGAALGVASLGSLAGALYRSSLPASAPAAAHDSVGEGAHAAQEIGGTQGASLLEQVARAFTHGMTPAFAIGSALALVAAAAAWAWIPRGIRPTENAH